MLSKTIRARFYQTASGNVPVRDWLMEMALGDRKAIGVTISAVEHGWPIGMPVCRSIQGVPGLWEVRIRLEGHRAARVLFTIDDHEMLLLHGFFKTTEKTPDHEIAVAVKRMKGFH